MNNTYEEFSIEKVWNGKWQGLMCLKNLGNEYFLAIMEFGAF